MTGGKRSGAGRKKSDPPTRARCVYLTDKQVKLLRMWGRGDVSAGLRWLIEAASPLITRSRLPEAPAPSSGRTHV